MKPRPARRLLPAALLAVLLPDPAPAAAVAAAVADEIPFRAGVARVDITPTHPVRLSGYGTRREEATAAAQRLWAKALAFTHGDGPPFLLLTVDNCGVPAALRAEVLRRLEPAGVAGERLAIAFTHTHSAPCLTGVLPNLFAEEIPPAHQANIDRYTRRLADQLVAAGRAALGDLRPARLEWGQGKARFAFNRRAAAGPVDHDLPVLAVRAPDGGIRALLASYAAHCTALGADFNQSHGDWAGAAQESLERDHPGATALIAIGGAGECIPAGVRELPAAARLVETARLGDVVAAEVGRLLAAGLRPVSGAPVARLREIELPLAPLPARAEWEARLRQPAAVAYHARRNLERLDRGEALPDRIPYPVQAWSFGRDLAMVFLAGEVVGDYPLRLKEEFDADRIWINGYTNAAPGYIPSRRVLALGAYEAVASTRYYDLSASFAPEVEERIVAAVHAVVPPGFLAATRTNPLPRSTSPEEALAALRPRPGLVVELVAAEPQVVDPIAVEFGPDGRVWVVEMRDYPLGLDGRGRPGGRITVLADRDGDGRYEESRVFLDGLSYPTGVLPWRNGALVCAAPDLLLAEDTDGDGRADRVRPLLTGFATDNHQARVNGLAPGLDLWIHAANGLRGGVIRAPGQPERVLDLRGQDFRFQPDTGAFEAVPGRSQQGRVRDDWGHWFGCTAGNLVLHFPLADRHARRNPHVPAPAGTVTLPGGPRARLHSLLPSLRRFNQPGHANQVTSACGLGLYRDTALGAEFLGDAFTCEPAHAVVTRVKLSPQGATFTGTRVPDEQDRDFLASTSAWFTPVQARTGPDGGLWVVDMARPVIEHPRWIPPERLEGLPVRAGDTLGRLFRVRRPGVPLRPVEDLTRLDLPALVARLDSPNGTVRDRVQLELAARGPRDAAPLLDGVLRGGAVPAARAHALALLADQGGATQAQLAAALRDPHPNVRRFALTVAEPHLAARTELDALLPALARDADLGVRTQLAFALGEWHDPAAAAVLLAELAAGAPEDLWMRAAVVSSAIRAPGAVLSALGARSGAPLQADLLRTALAAGAPPAAVLPWAAAAVAAASPGRALVVVAGLQAGAEARGIRLAEVAAGDSAALAPLRRAFAEAARVAVDPAVPLDERVAAARLLDRGWNVWPAHLPVALGLLDGAVPPPLAQAALEVLRRHPGPDVTDGVLRRWPGLPPSLRPPAVDLLAARGDSLARFLAALESGAIPVSAVPALSRQRLLRTAPPELRPRVGALFAAGGSPGRREVLARYRGVAGLTGDPRRGLQVFQQACSSCHVFVGTNAVGPPLGNYRDKSVEEFLVAILDPNAAVEPRYAAYSVTLRDGRALAGVISDETGAGFTLVTPGNVSEHVARADVAAIQALGTSLMPEGLEAGVSPQDMADLIAYLTSNR